MIVENPQSAADVPDDVDGAVGRAATAVRNLILSRQFVPGQQLRQEELAQHIGMSRGPLREALQVLAAEGVLNYVRNRGYFVTQFTADEMKQVYTVRDLLESEILANLPPASPEHIAALRALNAKIRDDDNDLLDVIHLNKRFHDLIVSHSPLSLLIGEIEQIGRRSIAYQGLSINYLSGWGSIADDHEKMIAALEDGDLAELVKVARVHRSRTLTLLLPMLP